MPEGHDDTPLAEFRDSEVAIWQHTDSLQFHDFFVQHLFVAMFLACFFLEVFLFSVILFPTVPQAVTGLQPTVPTA